MVLRHIAARNKREFNKEAFEQMKEEQERVCVLIHLK